MKSGRLLPIAAVVLLLVIGAWWAWRAALGKVREQIAAALGPGARIEAIEVGFGGVEIRGVSVPGTDGWPVEHALRAERVRVVPALRTALSDTIVVRSVTVDKPYVSAVRTREGELVILPTVLDASTGDAGAAAPSEPAEPSAAGVRIASISFAGGEVELFDRSVGGKPWRLHLIDVHGNVEGTEPPGLRSRMPFEIAAAVDGPQRDGAVALDGWFDGATQDVKTDATLRGVDLLALEPYIVHGTRVHLARGTFDLSLDATVRSRRLNAPGHLVLADIAFKPGSRSTDFVLGVPRDALLKAMAARDGRIALDFRLEGDVDDPRFSLNEAFATRIAVSMADSLGVTVGGLVKDVSKIGAQGLDGAGKATKELGGKLKGMFDRD